jgi:hypothetical protein
MEEQVKISNVSLGEGKMSFTVELSPGPFWERQIKLNDHRSILKRALLDSLKNDAPYDTYVSLVPEIGKIEVVGLERLEQVLEKQFRKYNRPPEVRNAPSGLTKDLRKYDADGYVTEVNEGADELEGNEK